LAVARRPSLRHDPVMVEEAFAIFGGACPLAPFDKRRADP
jgi:hypothetical protein